MGFGAASTLRLIAAVFHFFSEVFNTVADTAEIFGTPEISTPCALVVVALVASGHYTKGLLSVLVFTLLDLVVKEFPELPLRGSSQ